MAVVTVQVGQCGNQLGASLFDALVAETDAGADEYSAATRQTFFRARRGDGALVARAALIDMEPKVVAAAIRGAQSRSWAYDEAAALTFESGSGNNWARGYYTYGPAFRERAADVLRREAEAADRLGGFLLLQSMAGGTGAGLGTYLVESLRDDYPATSVLSHCVWPYESGEVTVQSYNTLLTLAGLLDAADGIILVQNESLAAAASRMLQIARPSLVDLNGLAARHLAAALLPAQLRDDAAGASPRPAALFEDVLSRLCCSPAQRLLTLFTAPQMPPRSVDFTTFTWPSLLKRMRQMLVTGSTLEEGLDWSAPPQATCAAALLMLRGKDAASADTTLLADAALYSGSEPEPLRVMCHPKRFGRCDMMASLLANTACAAVPARRMLGRAYALFSSRAYCHQYQAHGLELGDFEAAFARCEDACAAWG